MTHLLDTDICSFHMKKPAGLAHRFFQYAGGLAISSITLAELYAGAYRLSDPNKLLSKIDDLLQDVGLVAFDAEAAERYGNVYGTLVKQGRTPPVIDTMNASLALLHNLTLVTHNTQDYQHVPELRLEDWLIP